MVKKNSIYILTCFILLFSYCKTEDITPDVQFLEHSYFGNCHSISFDDKEVVICSSEEYKAFFEARRNGQSECSESQPTEIDFDKYSLIGALTEASGCFAEYDRKIEQKGNKEVTYHVVVTYSGGCLPLRLNMNWALIPKIKKRTDVSFDVSVVGLN